MPTHGQQLTREEEIDKRVREKLGFGKEVKGPTVQPCKDILTIEKYTEYHENINYTLLLHIIRMTLLVKLVNKSQNLRNLERNLKHHKGQAHAQDTGVIENDLFQINQNIKNEIGKDQDMIETYFQESLKSMYLAVIEYLTQVQQTPDFLMESDGESSQESQSDKSGSQNEFEERSHESSSMQSRSKSEAQSQYESESDNQGPHFGLTGSEE